MAFWCQCGTLLLDDNATIVGAQTLVDPMDDLIDFSSKIDLSPPSFRIYNLNDLSLPKVRNYNLSEYILSYDRGSPI